MAISNIQRDATIGSPTNNWEDSITISHTDGSLRLQGDATQWEDLRFPASGINPPGTLGDADVDNTTFYGTLLFDDASTEIMAGVAQMPHAWKEGSAIYPHLHWGAVNTSGGDVIWKFAYEIQNINSPFTGSLLSAQYTVSATTNANDHQLTPLHGGTGIDMTGKKISCMMYWVVSRIGGSDTLAGDARVWEFDIHYEVDAFGSNSLYVKD